MNAYELIRIERRVKPRRDWPARWRAAGESVAWRGALKRRFIALKRSPIWKALGKGVGGFSDATQQSKPPFAYKSGMGWKETWLTSARIINERNHYERT